MYATSLPVARAREDGVKMAVGLLCTGALGAVALGAATGSGTHRPAVGYPAYSGVPASLPNAPGAVPALILGILGLVICGICAPFAWWQGKSAEDAIASSGGSLGGKGMATAGKILGMIGTVLLVVGIVLGIVLIVFGVAGSS
jgi:hypothetical protein